MSGFVCILRRDGGRVERGELDRLRGAGAGLATRCRGSLGVALDRTAQSAGDEPGGGVLVEPRTGRLVAVAGRLVPPDGAATPGALAAALAGAPGADPDLLAACRGSFTVLVADPARGHLTIAADHLGSRGVYYSLDRRRLVAASEPAAVLRHPAVVGDLDQASVARFLGFRHPATDRSFFAAVRALPPAHRLRVTPSEQAVEQYWRFRRLPGEAERPPEELAERFLEALRRSVADQVAGHEPSRVAVSLSGGLDSTAVAAVAPRGVRAFSWTFEESPEADERWQIEAVSEHLGLPLRCVAGDGLHPLAGEFAERFVEGSSPHVNPFAPLKCRLYEAARAAGCHRVLVGDGGDALYAEREYWLRDLLAHRRSGALGSLLATLRRAAQGDRLARRALNRLLPVGSLRRRLRGEPRWLTRAGRAALPPSTPSPILPAGRTARRHELTVGARHVELERAEHRLSGRCGVERGNPFWSWPLLEATMQLPAYRLHRDGRSKLLTRRALRGLLPETVLEGERQGLLGRFFLRGLELRRRDLRQMVLRRPRSDWPRYVRRDWLEPYLEAHREIAFGHTILWRVISYELWWRRLAGDR